MSRFSENAAVYLIGSGAYSLLEILWRGFTHWSMALTGGCCFLALYKLNERWQSKPLVKKCLLSATVITAIEFAVGCLVNRRLKLNVWDYSQNRGNIKGQICPLFFVLWSLLSIPICLLTGSLHRRMAN